MKDLFSSVTSKFHGELKAQKADLSSWSSRGNFGITQ